MKAAFKLPIEINQEGVLIGLPVTIQDTEVRIGQITAYNPITKEITVRIEPAYEDQVINILRPRGLELGFRIKG